MAIAIAIAIAITYMNNGRDPSFFLSAYSIFSIRFSNILALDSFTFFDPLLASLLEIQSRFSLPRLLCFSEFNSGLGFMGRLARLASGVKFSFLGF
ncbi:hypothetical protein E2542_SST02860 [Spatholobus suberectus]|nr:hypothetical protein E2542_SST02860 [Spatholobus suberectus]